MSKDSARLGGVVPRLRFAEFRGCWVPRKLGQLGSFIGGGTPDKSVSSYWQGNIPWVSSSDICEDNIHTIAVTRFINEKSIAESATKMVPKGSVLFVSRVGTGKLAINKQDLCTSQDFTNFMPKKIYNYFLGYFFSANKSALIQLGQGTSIKGFSKNDLEGYGLLLPSENEQQKIADCLSSLDQLIIAEVKKLDALKAHKKGLMQQLFPIVENHPAPSGHPSEGGESQLQAIPNSPPLEGWQAKPDGVVPKLRFAEFRDAPKWSERQISDFLSESRIPGSQGNVAKKITVKLWGNGVFEKNEVIRGSANTQYYRRRAGQFIYSKLDFTNQAFGIIPVSLDNYESTIDLPCFDIADGLNPVFLLEYVKRKYFYEKKGEMANGSRKAKRIQIETFLSFSIFLPKLEEQQKISDCLSSLDDLISAQAQKLELLKAHKKGLMQGLFPNLDNRTFARREVNE